MEPLTTMHQNIMIGMKSVVFLANMLLSAPNGSRLSGRGSFFISDMPLILQDTHFRKGMLYKSLAIEIFLFNDPRIFSNGYLTDEIYASVISHVWDTGNLRHIFSNLAQYSMVCSKWLNIVRQEQFPHFVKQFLPKQ